MKEERINILKDRSNPITIAFILYFAYVILAIVTIKSVQYFFGYAEIGQVVNSIVILISYSLIGKLCFNINYKELLHEIKIVKNSFLDNLSVAIFITLIAAVFVLVVNQISFMIYPNKTESISYIIQTSIEDNNVNTNYSILFVLTYCFFTVAIEEVVFRYTLYRVFVKKNQDVKTFIILSAMLFAMHHLSSITQIVGVLFYGGLLAIIYLITKSIAFTFISHSLWNFASIISSSFIGYYSNSNMSFKVFNSAFTAIMMLCLWILLSIFSYYKRGYILSFKIKEIVCSLKSGTYDKF